MPRRSRIATGIFLCGRQVLGLGVSTERKSCKDDGKTRAMALVSLVGGMGFIGSRLASDLSARGDAVRIVDAAVTRNDDGQYLRVDVRDRHALAASIDGSDVIYSLAAVHRDDIKPASLYDEVNVLGAVNLCDACRELGILRIVFTSSVAVYSLVADELSEDSTTEPSSAYGSSKLRAEQVYRDWQAEEPNSRSLVIVRPTVVFGEGNRGNVYQLFRQIWSRRFVMVGNGRNRKSMAYVGNVSAFLVHVLGLGAGVHTFNYVDGPDLSMEELVDTILIAFGRQPKLKVRIPYVFGYLIGVVCDAVAAASNRRLPISAARIRKFRSTTTFSAQRTKSIGFQPPTSLREALLKTIKHEFFGSARSD